MNQLKVYVKVLAEFYEDGRILPLSVIWEDGRKFDIDKTTDIRRAQATKAGGTAIRYTVLINGRQTYLFCDDGKWFVERNQ